MSAPLGNWSRNYRKENEDVVQRAPVFKWSVVIRAREYQQHRIWDIVGALAELMTANGESRFASTVLPQFCPILPQSKRGKFRAAERCR